MFEELGLKKIESDVMQWAETSIPHLVKNKNLCAQMYYTNVVGKDIPPMVDIKTIAQAKEEFKRFVPTKKPDGQMTKYYASLRVVIVNLLENNRKPYFGCPICLKKVDKNVGVCRNFAKHTEEVPAEDLKWQFWQAGDATDTVTLGFPPGRFQKQEEMLNHDLIVSGSINERDATFSVSSIVSNKVLHGLDGKPLRILKKTDIPVSNPVTLPVRTEALKVTIPKTAEKKPEPAVPVLIAKTDPETPTGDIKLTYDEITELDRGLKKVLKKSAVDNPMGFDSLLIWARVQLQFKKWPKGKVREEAAAAYLKSKENDYFTFTDKDHVKALTVSEDPEEDEK